MLTIAYLMKFLYIPIFIFIGLCFLERFLARKDAAWPGLILPVAFFLFLPLPILLSALFEFDPILGEYYLSLLVAALIYSIPGTILTIIYVAGRKTFDRQKKSRDELRKMDIQDL